MRTRPLGRTGIEAGVLGYGAASLSVEGRPSEEYSMRLLQCALSRGVNVIDTADTYCLGSSDLHHNEWLIARAIKAGAQGLPCVLVATKGGTVRTKLGWEIDGRPERLYRAICDSYVALGGEAPIPLWQHHWPDPRYPVKAMLLPVQRAVNENLVHFVGVANYTLEQIKQARDVVDVVSVQNQYNLWHREPEQDGVIEYCEQQDLVFVPWRPLGGLGLAQCLNEIKPLADVARNRGISPQRLMIAWHLAKSKCILPIMGSRQIVHLVDCLAAADVGLERDEIAQLDAISTAQLARRSRASAWEQMPPLAGDGNVSGETVR